MPSPRDKESKALRACVSAFQTSPAFASMRDRHEGEVGIGIGRAHAAETDETGAAERERIDHEVRRGGIAVTDRDLTCFGLKTRWDLTLQPRQERRRLLRLIS